MYEGSVGVLSFLDGVYSRVYSVVMGLEFG